jgi:tight adherence protein C
MTNYILIGFALGVAGLLSLFYGLYALNRVRATQRVEQIISEELQAPTGQSLENRIVTGSIISRTVSPALDGLLRFLGRFTPANSIRQTGELLIVAGNPLNLQPTTFYGLRLILLFIGGVLTFLSIRFFGLASLPAIIQAYFILFVFYAFPIMWLRSVAQRRRQAIREELPDALDLLSVLASAGFNFNQSLARINEQWDTILGKEFGRVISEVEIGISLEDALKNFAGRVDVAELTSFVAVIVQSNRLGIRIADVLLTQAEQMRVIRQFRAKEFAQKMPAKMMIPLALFILPALIYIIIVPAFLTVLVNFSQ